MKAETVYYILFIVMVFLLGRAINREVQLSKDSVPRNATYNCPFCHATIVSAADSMEVTCHSCGNTFRPQPGQGRVDKYPDGWGQVMEDMPTMTEEQAQEFLKDIADKKRQS